MSNDPVSRACWCGNDSVQTFNDDYGLCTECGTLVSMVGLTTEQAKVNDDEQDFYGKRYWFDHQTDDLGLPDIYQRARSDVSERNLHWLSALLKFRLPPARSLELGCSHGSFVALMRQVGFDAMGIEMSPWVVEFGRRAFGIPMSIGPVENLDVAPGSMDVIVLMDVLEHLPDPVTTMAHCRKLLKPDGILLVQTPRFEEDRDYAALVDADDAFLEMLQPDEHLYLFSQRAAARLFQQIGAEHIEFEPAIFPQYDMFFVASSEPQVRLTEGAAEQHLLGTPEGRVLLALLDLRKREQEAVHRVQSLTRLLKESEEDRAARAEQIETLGRWLAESETDRTARGEQIGTLDRLLKESESDRLARGKQIDTLTALVKQLESDRAMARGALSGLFSHPSFQLASRVAGWEEMATLRGWLQDDDG